ncbi:unnamed protein product [Rhizophagus irregularis]|uniref:Uncharacterized protein n=1 Tax=Rhizophagus irregularis TaxID=588596 RepID=A0A915ZEV3_9GLOM|nr:hypothetical protein RIR_jg11412.t1 [Rhizophagus irregularis DAOM 181602=DAOM 197198]CAB5371639.1 unnamed protein product [Rhizophagus irregularis]CAB5383624.1 unnamed protein product [Rhizophagus irregularis]
MNNTNDIYVFFIHYLIPLKIKLSSTGHKSHDSVMCKRRKLKALSQNSSWEIKPTYLDINLRNIRVRLINDIEY